MSTRGMTYHTKVQKKNGNGMLVAIELGFMLANVRL